MSGYLTETDQDDGSEPPLLPVQPSLPEGISAGRDHQPAPQLRDNRTAPVDEPFNIIETDDEFRPIQPGAQRSEPRLDEIDAGPRSLVERQAAEDAADQAAGRAPRLRSRQERRAAQRQGKDRTLQENAQLRREIEELRVWRENVEPRIAQFEPRLQEIDQARAQDQVVGLDRSIVEAQARATAARRSMSEAIVSGDAEAVDRALEQRDTAIMEQQRLQVQRNMLLTGDPLGLAEPRQRQGDPRQQRQEVQQQPQAPRPLPPRAQALANDFAARHEWLNSRDPTDQRWTFERDTALRLDNEVAREGYNPSDLEYWEVLEDRMRQYMPHRFDEPAPTPPARQNGNGNGNGNGQRRQEPAPERRGPMVPGGGGAPRRGGNEVYLSPARKQALMDAGILGRDGTSVENQEKFRRTLKQFQEYDRANGTVRQ